MIYTIKRFIYKNFAICFVVNRLYAKFTDFLQLFWRKLFYSLFTFLALSIYFQLLTPQKHYSTKVKRQKRRLANLQFFYHRSSPWSPTLGFSPVISTLD